jgi:predicted ArsR family transcriptional regulator
LLLIWLLRQQTATLEEMAAAFDWQRAKLQEHLHKLEAAQQVMRKTTADGTQQYTVRTFA